MTLAEAKAALLAIYDEFEAEQMDSFDTGLTVERDPDDPNRLLVTIPRVCWSDPEEVAAEVRRRFDERFPEATRTLDAPRIPMRCLVPTDIGGE